MRKLDATENAADRVAKPLNSCVGRNVGHRRKNFRIGPSRVAW